MSGPLGNAAAGINATLGRSLCIDGPLKDMDMESPGVQADCQAIVRGDTDETVTLRECGSPGAGSCYRVTEAPEVCGGTPTTLALDLSGAGEFASGHRIELQCRVP